MTPHRRHFDLTFLLIISWFVSATAAKDEIPPKIVCKRITLKSDGVASPAFTFIVSYNYNTNDVNAVYSSDTNTSYALSDFNAPDNQFSPSQPYFDSSGLSFILPPSNTYKCSTTTCLYNLYSLDKYYLAYSSNNIYGPVQTVVVHPFASDSLCPVMMPATSAPSLPPRAAISNEPTIQYTTQLPSKNSQTIQPYLPSLLPELSNNPSVSIGGPACRQVSVSSLNLPTQPFIIIVFFNQANNNVFSIYSNDSTTQYSLSDFNTADNAFYPTQPYVDSFGLSFQAPKFAGFDCGASTCNYNIYSNPTYYISFSNENSKGRTNSISAVQVNSTNSCLGLQSWSSPIPSVAPSHEPSSVEPIVIPNQPSTTPFTPTIKSEFPIKSLNPTTNPAFLNPTTTCSSFTLNSSTSSILPVSFQVYFDTITNDAIAVLSSDASTQYPLSEFNFADNYFFPDEPYLDNFGLSFLAPAIDGYSCLSDSCVYNIYYLGKYYISFAASNSAKEPIVTIALAATTGLCTTSGKNDYFSPTSVPSIGPPGISTVEPSSQRALKPYVLQSVEPTNLITNTPSTEPASQLTHQPISLMTHNPIHIVTIKPTSTPSKYTLRPSSMPSLQSSPSINHIAHTTTEPSLENFGPTVEPSPQSIQFSSQPSSSPTSVEPSIQTLIEPSSYPLQESSRKPVPSPSMNSLSSPSSKPSIKPFALIESPHPTLIPSALPSETPTEILTLQPFSSLFSNEPSFSQITVEPSSQQVTQSFVPSSQPTTFQPTMLKSSSPSSRPSHSSMHPSKFQSSNPQSKSRLSFMPSFVSSATPLSFFSPSSTPAKSPSRSQPTLLPPSNQPASGPSIFPVNVPIVMKASSIPSITPVLKHSFFPSLPPISKPSSVPSSVPIISSLLPSFTPSYVPTVITSSSSMTHSPTLKHTSAPSSLPMIHAGPTFPPSSLPSNVPIMVTSLSPIYLQTLKPSSVPSSVPIVFAQPSYPPSSVLSNVPIMRTTLPPIVPPTSKPIFLSSPIPTSLPSNFPSTYSSITTTLPSTWPTVGSTRRPFHAPTFNPSNSRKPAPSENPTFLLSSLSPAHPTSAPTLLPTQVPLIAPTTAPSSIQPSSLLHSISIKPSLILVLPTQPPATFSLLRCPARVPMNIVGDVSSKFSIAQVIRGATAAQLIQTGANVTFAQTVDCLLQKSYANIPIQVTVTSISAIGASLNAIPFAATNSESLTGIYYMIQYWSPTTSHLNTDYEDITSTLNRSTNDGTLLKLFNAYCNNFTATATAYSPPQFFATTTSPSPLPVAGPSEPFPAQTAQTSSDFVQANLPLIVALSILAAICLALFCVLLVFTSYKRKEKQKEEFDRWRGQSIISVDSADSMDLQTIYVGAGAKARPGDAKSVSGSEDGASASGNGEHNLGDVMPLPSPAMVWRPRSISTESMRSRSAEGVHVPGGNEAWARRARTLSSASLRISKSRGKSVTQYPASSTAQLQPQILMELPEIIKVTEEGSGNWARRSQWSAEENVAEPCFLSFPSQDEDHDSDPELGSTTGHDIHRRDSESDSLSSLSYGLNSDIA